MIVIIPVDILFTIYSVHQYNVAASGSTQVCVNVPVNNWCFVDATVKFRVHQDVVVDVIDVMWFTAKRVPDGHLLAIDPAMLVS